ncbi:MAG TPA: magnesium-translocating P-type ATPase [archaeon]|nr:magnesium-translocating P-type ATPase [archaeon]
MIVHKGSGSEKTAFWAMQKEEVFGLLKSAEEGLSAEEAGKRLEENGPNELREANQRHALHILISQFKNSLILVLIFATIIAYALGEQVEAFIIIAIVFISCLLGFFQEYRAERALRELEKLVTIKARAMRSGKLVEIDSRELVLGDIVHLHIGDLVPADILLLKTDNLTANESALTGESLPSEKQAGILAAEKSHPHEMRNTVFMGTSVASGWGYGIVIATGEKTFFGKTASSLKTEITRSGFHKSITEFSNFLLKIVAIMTVFIFIVNAFLRQDIIISFLFALAVAVGITPEVLPIVITVSLSKAALKMSKLKVITKNLVSIEDFGNIDVLCCDKTGTLTEDELSLQKFVNLEEKTDEKIFLYGLLCNSASRGRHSFGNSIDRAIWHNEKSGNFSGQMKKFTVIDENEFDFERRRMSVIAKKGKESVLIAKGSPEAVLEACSFAMQGSSKKALSKEAAAKIRKQAESFESQGYRAIAVAEKTIAKTETTEDDEAGMVFLGWLLFSDPPKKTVKEALETFTKLDVAVKILSGDSPVITKKICEEVGLEIIEGKVISGAELEAIEADKFDSLCGKYNVFARLSPEQKAKIVSSLNRQGHITGFLGDGINDAPALHAATVGISVDSATGIAKEAADIILLKKSLRVLASGIVEGRRTFANITKYILNTISANYGNMFTVAASSLFLKFIPLLPAQILLNNLLSDVPMISISTDNVDARWLKKPKHWDIKLIRNFMVYFGLISTVFDLILIFALLFIANAGTELFRTAWFLESVLSEIIVTFAIRTSMRFFKSRPSKLLLISSLVTGIIAVAITFSVIGNILFEFEPMPPIVLVLIAAVLIGYFATAEIAKGFFFRRFEKPQQLQNSSANAK